MAGGKAEQDDVRLVFKGLYAMHMDSHQGKNSLEISVRFVFF